MDKSKLLDQCGALGEDRTLLARVLDRAKQASERNIPAATDFLSPAQQAQAADLPCLFSDAITNEILLTDRAVSMPLDAGAAEWAKKAILLAKTYGRKNVSDKIIASGYDAAEMGKRMRRIYEQQ